MLVRLSCSTRNKANSRSAGKPLRELDVDINFDAAALGRAFHKPARRGGKADFVQQRRMQQVRSGADFVERLFGQRVDILA